jgi:general secretion pathway protein D
MGAPLGNLAQPGGYLAPGAMGGRNVFSIGGHGHNISGFVRLLKVFGTVRTLSNPRLTVLNNNAAVLKAATNHVFFRVNYQREIRTLNRPDVERASSEIHTIPVGLIMTVHPSIDLSTGRITLNLRPTITRITNEVEDPAVGILTSGQRSSTVPEVQVREMDSIIQIRTGEVVVLGGLMEERSDNIDSRTPVAGIEQVLRAKDDQRTVTELVILMRAYILPEDQSLYNSADARIYNNFTKDPRRLRLSHKASQGLPDSHAQTS